MTEPNSAYISDQVQRTLRVIRAMTGHEIHGMSPAEIAKLVNTNPVNVTRTLANLEAQKFVERLPKNDSRWRLSAAFVQIANTVSLNFNTAQQQLQQDQHNYSRVAI